MICKTEIGAQKIGNNRQRLYEMAIALFQVDHKDENSRFFDKLFLLADINMDITFGILFLIMRNVKVNFNNLELRYKFYTTAKALLPTKLIELIGKKNFLVIAIDPKDEIFIVFIVSLAIFN